MLLTDDVDASVLRFALDGENYLALVGEEPLGEAIESKVAAIWETKSDLTALPDDVGSYLRSRRLAFKQTGLEYLERRSQGGERP